MVERLTAGELSQKAASDTTRYDAYEVGDIFTHDVYDQLMICAKNHENQFAEPEFCLGLYIASDPLIHNVRRHKYCAFPWLPKPRPQQAVFLFKKSNQTIKRLWSLPDAKTMAIISEMPYVADKWRLTKYWSTLFFTPHFFEAIRKQHDIKMLSQDELDAHSAKIGHPRTDEVKGSIADTFDFSKIAVEKVIDKYEPVFD